MPSFTGSPLVRLSKHPLPLAKRTIEELVREEWLRVCLVRAVPQEDTFFLSLAMENQYSMVAAIIP